MEPVAFDDADSYEPEEGWERRSLADADGVSVEWFRKPPGHSSPTHDHENEQVCLCLAGELTVYAGDEAATLGEYDAVHLAGGEPHRVENTGTETAVGVDVFAPGRPFDFWRER
ncbi:MAG: cupin domain-containing protein [Halobacteriaceae archaeon]